MAKISEQAKQGMDWVFTKAVRTNLVMNQDDTIDISLLRKGTMDTPEKRIVLLTVASYVFRLLVIFHVDSDRKTREYFTKFDSNRDVYEAFGEVGNMCCGALNRDLGNYFLHMGMSTPYVLERECIPFLAELNPDFIWQYKIAINESVVLHATLCLNAHADIDFCVDHSRVEESVGELEMF